MSAPGSSGGGGSGPGGGNARPVASAPSPSSAVVHQLSQSIATDLSTAPLCTPHIGAAQSTAHAFLAVERHITATSEMLNAAIAHSNRLSQLANSWTSIAQGHDVLGSALDDSSKRVAGRRLSSMQLQPTTVLDDCDIDSG